MREIPLTRGLVAMVDDGDYESLSSHKWHALRGSAKFYAARRLGSRGTYLLMHRVILNAPGGMYVDHISGSTLDNRRSNIRVVTPAQNNMNRGASSTNKSGFKGVCWEPRFKFWRATIKAGGKHVHLGHFTSPQEAHAAYCAAAKELHGEYARFA